MYSVRRSDYYTFSQWREVQQHLQRTLCPDNLSATVTLWVVCEKLQGQFEHSPTPGNHLSTCWSNLQLKMQKNIFHLLNHLHVPSIISPPDCLQLSRSLKADALIVLKGPLSGLKQWSGYSRLVKTAKHVLCAKKIPDFPAMFLIFITFRSVIHNHEMKMP